MLAAEAELVALGELLGDLARHEPVLSGFFDGADEIVIARAPGRLDVLGGIADYSGSLVLEQPIAEAALVAVARTPEPSVRIASLGSPLRQATFPSPELFQACSSLAGARTFFATQPADTQWAAYALGGLAVLAGERGASLEGGLRVLVASAVPEGKGVSSSAAIEVATLRALAELWGVPLSGLELGLAGQRVENHVVGAPCGVMDQLTSACGEAGRLLAILCQPAKLCGSIALPDGLAVFGIDSGVRHAVVGSDYRQVRAAAFMGQRLLAERLGARVLALEPGRVALEGDPLRGYLANIDPEQLTPALLAALPENMSGADFLVQHHGTIDELTRVDATRRYMVRAATLHPIYEHERVRQLAERLPSATSEHEWRELGQLLYASHASYSACGLGSAGTDWLVDAVERAGPDSGLFGAKITGGGSGGTVAVLARADAAPRVSALAEAYARATQHDAMVFVGSSPGAMALPPLRKRC